MITVLHNHDIAVADNGGSPGLEHLALAAAVTADGAQEEAVDVAHDLEAVVAEFAHDEVGIFVECDADGVVELAVAARESKPKEGGSGGSQGCSARLASTI